jgi:thiamine-monophosphate kinase
MKQTASLPGEFEIIARYFAPLARGFPGAFGLLDDAAVIAPMPGRELVAKTDAIVGGVHFLDVDPPDLMSRTLGVAITPIGRMQPASVGKDHQITVLDASGQALVFDRSGWTHF